MNVYGDIFGYLSTQWANRTKLVYPNTLSTQFSGVYTDTTSVLNIYILEIGAVTLPVHIESTSITRHYFFLQCNICTDRPKGYGPAMGHADRLDEIFKNQTITISGREYGYFFGVPKREQAVPDDSAFVIPWTCEFTTYI